MVSIILPTYNSIAFLKERVDTILGQTHKNWECIVVDGNSTDGTWEYLTQVAENDKRFKLYLQPPQGVYPAWNYGIELAQGDYIYIATSDDTMSVDCLEKLVKALDENPDCGIAQCALTIIDENGQEYEHGWKWKNFPPSIFLSQWYGKPHKRMAPLDGILYCLFRTVYHSITQLLIKKTVFDTHGLFDTDFGSRGDFVWQARISQSVNTVFIPDYLATWRIHPAQATAFNELAEAKELVRALHTTYNPNTLDKVISKNDYLLTYQLLTLALTNSRAQKLKQIIALVKYPKVLYFYFRYVRKPYYRSSFSIMQFGFAYLRRKINLNKYIKTA